MSEPVTRGVERVTNEVFPLPVLIYGRPTCEDTALVRWRLNRLQVPFVEIDVDKDPDAARYVERVNHGNRTTPTIVFGDEDFIIVEPTLEELNHSLRRAGYEA